MGLCTRRAQLSAIPWFSEPAGLSGTSPEARFHIRCQTRALPTFKNMVRCRGSPTNLPFIEKASQPMSKIICRQHPGTLARAFIGASLVCVIVAAHPGCSRPAPPAAPPPAKGPTMPAAGFVEAPKGDAIDDPVLREARAATEEIFTDLLAG